MSTIAYVSIPQAKHSQTFNPQALHNFSEMLRQHISEILSGPGTGERINPEDVEIVIQKRNEPINTDAKDFDLQITIFAQQFDFLIPLLHECQVKLGARIGSFAWGRVRITGSLRIHLTHSAFGTF